MPIRLGSHRGLGETAEELVVDELGDGGVVAADGARGIAPGLSRRCALFGWNMWSV